MDAFESAGTLRNARSSARGILADDTASSRRGGVQLTGLSRVLNVAKVVETNSASADVQSESDAAESDDDQQSLPSPPAKTPKSRQFTTRFAEDADPGETPKSRQFSARFADNAGDNQHFAMTPSNRLGSRGSRLGSRISSRGSLKSATSHLRLLPNSAYQFGHRHHTCMVPLGVPVGPTFNGDKEKAQCTTWKRMDGAISISNCCLRMRR